MIGVEVAYATPQKQRIIALSVPPGTTAQQAAELSGIAKEFPGLDVAAAPKGIFGNALGVRGQAAADDYILQPGERVEIYRPLIADPKEVRKQRAAAAAQKRADSAGKSESPG
ncbi:MAG: RnfH family protein [Cellvibrionales bacterium]|nr:RnfH family protein [Cellvibrionales bacterium]